MAEETTTEGTVVPETTEPAETPQYSNADVKNHPLFKKLTGQLAELQKADFDRKEAQKAAEKNALLEKAKAEERYEDALKLQQEEHAAALAAYEAKITQAELRASLVASGAKATDGLLKVVAAEYDAEKHGTVDEYVDSLKASEDYAVFFKTSDRVPVPPPGKLPTTGIGVTLNKETIRAYESSDDPEKRKQARAYKREYYDKHGSFRGLLD